MKKIFSVLFMMIMLLSCTISTVYAMPKQVSEFESKKKVLPASASAPPEAEKLILGTRTLSDSKTSSAVKHTTDNGRDVWYINSKTENKEWADPLTLTFDNVIKEGIMGRKVRAVLKVTKAETKSKRSYSESLEHYYGGSKIALLSLSDQTCSFGGTSESTYDRTDMLYPGNFFVSYSIKLYIETVDSVGNPTGEYTNLKYPAILQFKDIDQISYSVKGDPEVKEEVRLNPSRFSSFYVWPSYNLKSDLTDSGNVRIYTGSDQNTDGSDSYKVTGLFAVGSSNNGTGYAKVQSGGNMASSVYAFTLYNPGQFGFWKRSSDTSKYGGAHFEGIRYRLYTEGGDQYGPDIVLNEDGKACDAATKAAIKIEVPEGNYYLQEIATNGYYKKSDEKIPITVHAGDKADYAQKTNIYFATDDPKDTPDSGDPGEDGETGGGSGDPDDPPNNPPEVPVYEDDPVDNITVNKFEMMASGEPGSNVSGITFTLYDRNHNKIKSKTTDSDGKVTFSCKGDGFTPGTYVIEETSFDTSKYQDNQPKVSGYDKPSYLVSIGSEYDRQFVSFINEENPNDFTIEIEKTPEENIPDAMASYSMDGIEYTVYSDSACSDVLGKITLSQKGGSKPATAKGSFTKVIKNPPSYLPMYVKETKVPENSGYLPDNKVYQANVIPGVKSVIKVTDPIKKGEFSVDKVIKSDEDSPGPGSLVFKLKSTQDPTIEYTASPDSNGHVKFENIYYGEYLLSESGLDNYTGGDMLNSMTSTKRVEVTKDTSAEHASLEWINEWIPTPTPPGVYAVIVEKKSSENTGNLPAYSMSGISYSVYKDNGLTEKVGDIELTGNGTAGIGMLEFEDENASDTLPLYLVENPNSTNGTGFKADDNVYEIEAKKGRTVVVNNALADEPIKGNLSFRKVITSEEGEAPSPENLVFTLTNVDNPSIQYTVSPDRSGNVKFEDVLLGEYKLTESGLNNYEGGTMKDSTGTQTIEIEEGENTLSTENNIWKNTWELPKVPVRFNLRIEKESTEEINLESYSMTGITYSVYSDAECTEKVDTIKLSGNSNSGIGQKSIVLYNANDTETFYVKETSIPDDSGFKIDDTVYKVRANKDEITLVKTASGDNLKDEPEKANLTFKKVITNEIEGEEAPDPTKLIFTLTNTENKELTYTANPKLDGTVEFEDVLIGKYTLSESGFEQYETDDSNGHMIDYTGEQTVVLKKGDNTLKTRNNEYVNLWSENNKVGKMMIYKRTDNPNNIDYTKFRFTVTNIATNSVVVDNEPLNRIAELHIDNLAPGNYLIHEDLTPEQLDLYYQPEDVTVTIEKGDQSEVPVRIDNKVRTSKVKIIKKSSDGNVDYLRFTLSGTSIDGTKILEKNVRTEVDPISGDGIAVFEDVIPGTYTVTEKSFEKYGYVTPHNTDKNGMPAQTITTDGSTDQTLTFTNIPVSFNLRKTEVLEDGMPSDNPVENAGYTVYRVSDLGHEPNSEEELDSCYNTTFFTDENGEIHDNGLSEGTYWLFETNPPEDYIIEYAEPPIAGLESSDIGKYVGSFTIDAEHPEASFLDTNQRETGTINLFKTDNSGNPVEGAEFTLFKDPLCLIKAKNVDNEEMVAVTDAFGSITVLNDEDEYESKFSDLAWGTYYLKETKAPRGYDADPEVYPVKIGQFGLFVEKLVVDERSRGAVELTKTDKDTGTLLNNAKFDLFTSKDELVKTGLVTGADNNNDGEPDGDGKIIVDGLDWDSYYFKESEAPEGYAVSTDLTRFAINAHTPINDTLKVTAVNEAAPAEIVVTVKMKASDFWDEHGNPTFFVVLKDSNGKVLKQPVTFDKAYVDKTTDNAGYVSKSVSFGVDSFVDYDVYTVKADRYELDRNYSGGSTPGPITDLVYNTGDPENDKVVLNVPETKTGRATFVYTKTDWSDYGDQTTVTNVIRKNRSYIGLTAVYKGDPEKVEANMLFEPADMLDVFAVFDDGSIQKLKTSEYTVTDSEGHSVDRFPSSAGPYLYNVSATIGNTTRTAAFTINVLPPQKVKVYFHTNSSAHIASPDGSENISGEDVDYIEIWKHQPLGQGINAAKYAVSWTGHELTGWYQDMDNLDSELDPKMEVTGDTHFYAKWDLDAYKITYVSDTPDSSIRVSNAPFKQTKPFGGSIEITSKIPVASKGYDFLGWSTHQNLKSESDVEYKAGDVYSNDANLLLYAVWKPHSAAVRYHANDDEFEGTFPATNMPSDSVAEYGQANVSGDVPVRPGYGFRGWALKKTGDVVYQADDPILTDGKDFTEAQMNNGIDLYAKWEQLHLGSSELSWDDIDTIGDSGIAKDFFSEDFSAVRSDVANDGFVSSSNLNKYTKAETINGNTVHFMIAGFDHDEASDGSTVAITFITYESVGDNAMEASGKAVTGWKNSTMRNSTLNSAVYGSMPASLRNNLQEMKKKSVNTSGNIDVSEEKISIPSVEELYGAYAYEVKP